MTEPFVLTPEEVASLLGLSRGLTYEGIRRGEIQSFRIGRRILISVSAIAQLLGEPTTEITRRVELIRQESNKRNLKNVSGLE